MTRYDWRHSLLLRSEHLETSTGEDKSGSLDIFNIPFIIFNTYSIVLTFISPFLSLPVSSAVVKQPPFTAALRKEFHIRANLWHDQCRFKTQPMTRLFRWPSQRQVASSNNTACELYL